MKSLVYNEEHIHNQKVVMVVFIFQKNILAVLKNKIIFALLKFSKFNKLSENKRNKMKIYFVKDC